MTDTPSVVPMIAYEDGFAALDWLALATPSPDSRLLASTGRPASADAV